MNVAQVCENLVRWNRPEPLYFRERKFCVREEGFASEAASCEFL
jgi:hypothetical protein